MEIDINKMTKKSKDYVIAKSSKDGYYHIAFILNADRYRIFYPGVLTNPQCDRCGRYYKSIFYLPELKIKYNTAYYNAVKNKLGYIMYDKELIEAVKNYMTLTEDKEQLEEFVKYLEEILSV